MTSQIVLPANADQLHLDLALYVCTTPPTVGNTVLASASYIVYIDTVGDSMRLWIVCPWCGLRHFHSKQLRPFPVMAKVTQDKQGSSDKPGGLGP